MRRAGDEHMNLTKITDRNNTSLLAKALQFFIQFNVIITVVEN